MTVKRFAFLGLIAAVVAICLTLGVAIVVNLVLGIDSDADAERLTRTLEIKTSRESTHFLGPLRADGTIDYIAAINQKLGEGVTHDNNAFRHIAIALCPDDPTETVARTLQALEVSEKELQESARFVRWADTYSRNGSPNVSESEERDTEKLREILDAPFTDEATQILAKWVQLNHTALADCTESLDLEHYWIPLVEESSNGGLLVGVYQPYNSMIRELSMCYRAQLLLAGQDGDMETAAKALRSLLRLAKHHSNAPSLIDGLLAIAFKSQAIFSIRDLVNQHQLSESMSDTLAAEWSLHDGRAPIVTKIDMWERCITLDALMQIASGRSSANQLLNGDSEQLPIDRLFIDPRFDVNKAISIVQSEYGDLIAAMRINDYKSAHARTAELYGRLEERSGWAQSKLLIPNAGGTVLNDRLSNPDHTEALARFLLSVTMPALGASYRTELRAIANYRNIYVVLAVERYYLDHGHLPDSLNQLIPDYIERVPADPFDRKPLKYRIIDGGYTVYSLGDNLRDDNGVHDYEHGDVAIEVNRVELSNSR